MRKDTLFSLFFILSSFFVNAQVKVFNTFDELEKEILQIKQTDTVYVVNFWATWCKPCVQELPYFEALSKNKSVEGAKVKVVLVSLDFPSQIEKKLIPFIKEHSIESQVVVLADPKANNWINRVDKEWSGAIPVTLFLYRDKKIFSEKTYDSEQLLKEQLEKIIQN